MAAAGLVAAMAETREAEDTVAVDEDVEVEAAARSAARSPPPL